MAQTVTLLIISLFFAILGFNELHFLSNARQVSATVVKLFTAVRTGDGVPIGESNVEIAKKATVKLDPFSTDGREGDTLVPASVWHELRVEDTLQVWSYAEKPKGVFWSPMIRYKKLKIWVRINFSVMSVFLVLAAASHIASID